MGITKLIVFTHDHWNYDDVLYHLASNFGLIFSNCQHYIDGHRVVKIILASIDDNQKLDKYLVEYEKKNNVYPDYLFETFISINKGEEADG